MTVTRKIELLAPAGSVEIGKAAINFGADAVYIGGPKFGARAAAGNSVDEISKLVDYAHKYHASVFVAFNTLLFDNELYEAQRYIHQLYQTGIDALIIQDMGILELDLPPIALHASTQCDNRTPEKLKFLENVGFTRAVLARELTIDEIKSIRAETSIELECFIHGALCVSLSGKCFLSRFIGNRSANRGNCAQPCRLPWNILNAEKQKIEYPQYSLSLKDLNRTESIAEMIDAGVCSFKIEGRLKDIRYVKNVTSHYRGVLDNILENKPGYKRSSLGKHIFTFRPDPENSFNRGFTEYFFHGRNNDIASPQSVKSKGKYLGRVAKSDFSSLMIDTDAAIHNGDGLCFYNEKNELTGIRVNTVSNNKISPAEPVKIKTGTDVYRNSDINFNKIIDSIHQTRKIGLKVNISENNGIIDIKAIVPELEISTYLNFAAESVAAENLQLLENNIKKAFTKTGDTDFEIEQIEIENVVSFIRLSKLNEMRRMMISSIEKSIINAHKTQNVIFNKNSYPYFKTMVDYSENVANKAAEGFYRRHGVTEIETGLDADAKQKNKALMTTKLCLQYQLGICIKNKNKNIDKTQIPAWIENETGIYKLEFDCENCVMKVIS